MGGRSGQKKYGSLRTRAATAATLAVFATIGVGTPQSAGGETELTAYEATAGADGVRVTVTLEPSILVPELVDLGAPTAQATADSLGNSSGYAATPFPGDLLLRGPALLLPTTGLPPDFVPPFPAIVESAHPTVPNDSLDLPGYRLASSSREGASTAAAGLGTVSADLGLGAVESTASANVEDDGTVVARGSTSITGLEVAGLTIARIETTSEVRARDVDDVEMESGLSVRLVGAAGLEVVLDDGGITVLGQRLPLPLLEILPISELLGVDGLEVEVLPEVKTASSIRSASLHIRTMTVLADGIPSVLPAGSVVTTDIVLGQTQASAGAAMGTLSTPPPVDPDEAAPPSTQLDAPTANVPVAVAPSPPVTVAPPTVHRTAPTVITTTVAVLARWSTTGAFGLIALSALGLFGASQSFRPRGAKR